MLIVIPMVGRGTRTKSIEIPKPLIKIKEKSIVQYAIESLDINGHYIFVIRNFSEYKNGDEYTEQLKKLLLSLKPNSTIVELPYITEGPAETVFLGLKSVSNLNDSLIVSNCDHALKWNSEKFLKFVQETKCDACVTTYPHIDSVEIGKKYPYSFVKLNDLGLAQEFEEKIAISNLMLNGIHYWKHAYYFVDSCKEMMLKNDRVNNEFYVSKTFNYLVRKGKIIRHYEMMQGEFFALGSAEEIEQNSKLL